MANTVQGSTTLYFLQETTLSREEYATKFNHENIIDMKLQITLSDGSVHMVSIMEVLDGKVVEFLEDEEKEKTTETEKSVIDKAV